MRNQNEQSKLGQPSHYSDVMTIEGADGFEVGERDYYAAVQRQINRGHWGLQGSHGRAMMEAIREGRCLLGKSDARDYYGNHIPSRSQVEGCTKGSRGFVAKAMGEDWASYMEAL